MSKFTDTLEELLNDYNLNIEKFAEKVGISSSAISNYLRGFRFPDIPNLIKIADFFNCSTDYLMGRENEIDGLRFKSCPPFCEQLKFLLTFLKINDNRFLEITGISRARFYDWKKGKRQPTIDNIIKISSAFELRIDFVLGRE